ncbi:Hsp20/alpha crystallin family protein [Halorubrum sp. DTA98]|uniref:Hsp20/alpha crystallin family protein n=1 Tax=Halorubrum sp. DTA98 TaxID=3402163 RepID=UPI003AAFFCB8
MPRRDPFREIEELFERMGREFEELGGTLDTPMSSNVAVDVVEGDDAVTVTADLPGYGREEINVELHDDALTIAATRTETTETDESDEDDEEAGDGVEYHVRERRKRAVSRRVRLPAPVDRDGASATYNNGVLTVTLPKRSSVESGGHSIDIS